MSRKVRETNEEEAVAGTAEDSKPTEAPNAEALDANLGGGAITTEDTPRNIVEPEVAASGKAPEGTAIVCNDPQVLRFSQHLTYHAIKGRQYVSDPEILKHLKPILDANRGPVFYAD